MTPSTFSSPRILAIDPSTRGFGFIVLEAPDTLADWGVKEARRASRGNKNEHCIRQIAHLLALYQPTLIALEDVTQSSRRCARVRELIRATAELGAERGVPVRAIGKPALRDAFKHLGGTSKDAIAQALARRFPEIETRLPPPRRTWEAQNPNMAIFKALAMAIAAGGGTMPSRSIQSDLRDP